MNQFDKITTLELQYKMCKILWLHDVYMIVSYLTNVCLYLSANTCPTHPLLL